MKRLFHATSDIHTAEAIYDNGFRGANVYDYENIIFFADQPLSGFGGYCEAWVAVDVPEEILATGEYDENYWDNDQYNANCYCFHSELINKYPRYLFINRVPGWHEFE